jgi:heat shock protein HslJ
LSGILGAFTPQQPKPEAVAETTEQQAAAAPPPKPAAAIKGLLGGLLGGKKSSGTSLAGTSWRWANSAQFVLTFNNDGTVASSTDCNTFSGTFTADGSKLGIGRLASTRKACQGSQEGPYAASLQDAASYTISGDTLSIGLKSGGSMSFRKNN